MERKLYNVNVTSKDKGYTSGNKVRFSTSVMLHLTKQMKQNDASLEEIMKFEKDFLEANGIIVPESFFAKGNRKESYSIIDDFLKKFPANRNTHGSTFYDMYCRYCTAGGFHSVGKQRFYDYLRDKNIMKDSATINGQTYRNVVLAYGPHDIK